MKLRDRNKVNIEEEEEKSKALRSKLRGEAIEAGFKVKKLKSASGVISSFYIYPDNLVHVFPNQKHSTLLRRVS
jgi:hypothetical protein